MQRKINKEKVKKKEVASYCISFIIIMENGTHICLDLWPEKEDGSNGVCVMPKSGPGLFNIAKMMECPSVEELGKLIINEFILDELIDEASKMNASNNEELIMKLESLENGIYRKESIEILSKIRTFKDELKKIDSIDDIKTVEVVDYWVAGGYAALLGNFEEIVDAIDYKHELDWSDYNSFREALKDELGEKEIESIIDHCENDTIEFIESSVTSIIDLHTGEIRRVIYYTADNMNNELSECDKEISKVGNILNKVICEGATYVPGGLKVSVIEENKVEEILLFLKELYKRAAHSFCDDLFSDFNPEECEMISIPMAVCELMDDDNAKIHPFSEVNIDGKTIFVKFSDNIFEIHGDYDAVKYGDAVADIMGKEMKANNSITVFEGFIGWWQTGGAEDDFCFAEISSTKDNTYALELVKGLIDNEKDDEKDYSKKKVKEISLGGMEDKPFSYENIDGISPSFYEGVIDGKGFIVSPDEVVNVDVNGERFVLVLNTEKKIGSVLKKFKKALDGKDVGRNLYNPVDVISGKYSICGNDAYGQDVYDVSDKAEKLETIQIAHRASIFAKVNQLLRDTKAATQIVEFCPKKKNGTFALKRVTQIASLFCMEDDASMYVLCAVAKKDTELLIEVRQIASVDMEKTYKDIISTSNLFRE